MNILFLSHRVPFPPNKGEKIRTFHQIKYLSENGHKIGVLSPIDSEDDHVYLNSLSDLHIELSSSIHALSSFRLPLGLLKNQPLSVANFYSKSLQKKFDELLESQAIDSIICSSSSMAEYIFNSVLFKSNPPKKSPQIIMDFMDLDSDKWRQYAQEKSFPASLIYAREASLLKRYERTIYKDFDASFFISEEEVKLFLDGDSNNGKLHSIGNGIDTNYYKATEVKKEIHSPVLVFTGVMDYLPNVDAVDWFARDVWPQIISKYDSAKFYIAGMNPNSRVSKLADIKGVIVTGKVDDIRDYYSSADVFVAPLRLARGVQNKVLQAFSAGVPVVSTSIGNEGINAKDGTEILIADDPLSFATQSLKLIDSYALRKNMTKDARELVEEKFSWEGQLTKLDSISNN